MLNSVLIGDWSNSVPGRKIPEGDVDTSGFGAVTLAIARRSFDATISALDAETSAIARSYRRGVSSDIGDCGVGITPQMCNRVTNHGDMSTFSKPDPCGVVAIPETIGGRRFRSLRDSLNIVKHCKTLLNIVKHHETLAKHCET